MHSHNTLFIQFHFDSFFIFLANLTFEDSPRWYVFNGTLLKWQLKGHASCLFWYRIIIECGGRAQTVCILRYSCAACSNYQTKLPDESGYPPSPPLVEYMPLADDCGSATIYQRKTMRKVDPDNVFWCQTDVSPFRLFNSFCLNFHHQTAPPPRAGPHSTLPFPSNCKRKRCVREIFRTGLAYI